MKRMRAVFLLALITGLGAAFAARTTPSSNGAESVGQAVYMAEGCIHCHSQYSRPGTRDSDRYGPPSTLPHHSSANVLIGNRRQGPDLSNVGLRRSRSWNRAHLLDPQAVSPGSRMPRYAYLFEGDGQRGEALLDYLDSLGAENADAWVATQIAWQPPLLQPGNFEDGRDTFMALCAQCHGRSAQGAGPLADSLDRTPANLRRGPFRYLPPELSPELRRDRLARIIKFGLSGTPMPGHEYLDDRSISNLITYLETIREPL